MPASFESCEVGMPSRFRTRTLQCGDCRGCTARLFEPRRVSGDGAGIDHGLEGFAPASVARGLCVAYRAAVHFDPCKVRFAPLSRRPIRDVEIQPADADGHPLVGLLHSVHGAARDSVLEREASQASTNLL